MEHCVDSSDETDCVTSEDDVIMSAPRPGIIDLFGGSFVVREELGPGQPCPSTHFSCPANGYCLPVYLRCNGVLDCQFDESDCNSLTCSGFYQCRASTVCLHPDHVCDGWPQCPQHDDELFCDLICPQSCSCHGLAFTCFQDFQTDHYTDLRYLNASGSGIQLHRLFNYTMLIYLNLALCHVGQMLALNMPNLHILDLRINQLHVINLKDFILMTNLQQLFLARNPITGVFPDNTSHFFTLKNVRTLDISGAAIEVIDSSTFSSVPNLQILDLSNNSVDLVFPSDCFKSVKNLRALNIRGFTMAEFSKDLLLSLSQLQELYTDNFKLCCPVVLPAMFHVDNCQAPSNELSSCDGLLRSVVYRTSLGLFSILAVLGNILSFLIRIIMYRKKRTGHSVFVTHLCVSDFLMGMYLVFIGVADHLYEGNYLWKDLVWRHSAACQMAGFLSFLSSEVSALIICLITLDRFLVLQFPFSHLRFGYVSAQLMMCVVWVAGMVLAGLPLLPSLPSWHFYSQTGICIPLPVTRKEFVGHDYAFGVMIILNFSLFLLIAVGQVSIFMSIRAHTFSSAEQSNAKRSQDLGIARRLFVIILTDFLCWFPVGVLGLLSSQRVPIAGEVNVALAIFVLPFNSVLNPFLYTISMLGERRQRRKEQRLLKFVQAKANSVR